MNFAVLNKALDLLIQSPGKEKRVAIYGGEPLLHFDTVAELVRLGKRKARLAKKSIEFSLATNGLLIDTETIKFLKKNNIKTSVSVDCPQEIHDANRKTNSGQPTHEDVSLAIARMRKQLPPKNISALLAVAPSFVSSMSENFFFIVSNLHIENINIEPIQNSHWGKKKIEIFKSQLIKIFNMLLAKINTSKPFYINSLNRTLSNKIANTSISSPFSRNLIVFSDGNISTSPFLYYTNSITIGNAITGISIGPTLPKIPPPYTSNIIQVLDYFCTKMADFLIRSSQHNPKIKAYIAHASKRVFE